MICFLWPRDVSMAVFRQMFLHATLRHKTCIPEQSQPKLMMQFQDTQASPVAFVWALVFNHLPPVSCQTFVRLCRVKLNLIKDDPHLRSVSDQSALSKQGKKHCFLAVKQNLGCVKKLLLNDAAGIPDAAGAIRTWLCCVYRCVCPCRSYAFEYLEACTCSCVWCWTYEWIHFPSPRFFFQASAWFYISLCFGGNGDVVASVRPSPPLHVS